MSRTKHDIAAHLRLDQIKAYSSGKLSHEEMHLVEKHLLTCQLCADAVEGVDEQGGAFISTDVEALRDQLKERISQPAGSGTSKVKIYRIAATVAFLLIATLVILNIDRFTGESLQQEALSLEDEKAAEEIAAVDSAENTSTEEATEERLTEERDNTAEVTSGENLTTANTQSLPTTTGATMATTTAIDSVSSAIGNDKADDGLVALETAPEEKKLETEIENGAGEDAEPRLAFTRTEADSVSVFADEDAAVDDVFAETQQSDNSKDKSVSREEVAKRSAFDRATEPNEQSHKINGVITSAEDGAPLPGVNVILKGSTLGVVTDVDGSYQIDVPSDEGTLVYNFIGLQTQELEIAKRSNINVSLNTDVTQLSEVVVMGYSSASQPDLITRDAYPVGGNPSFKKYVRDNLNYPQQALDNSVSGRVTLEFTVSSSGVLSNFNVLRSLGYGCDQEAIRLVREGPAWNPAMANGTTTEEQVRVRLKFDPPK